MEYGNGIVGDMCVHMYDTARWMLGLGWLSVVITAHRLYLTTRMIMDLSSGKLK